MGALMAGANDFAIKPSGTKNFQAAKEQVQSELITRIWNLVGTPAEVQEKLGTPKVEQVSRSAGKPPTETPRQREVPTRPARREKLPPQVQTPSPRGSGKVSLVAIGVSTGGPEALGRLIAKLPKPFSIPILITQHMPPVFTGLLAERLSQQTGQRVRDAKHGDVVTAGAILIAPGDFHMTVCRDKNSVLTQLDKSPPENS
jgi:two-component system chemotaxis response regulator CheB